ncbi:MAG: hypothetical protein ACRDTK_02295 [Mycobacterium sp.]
MKADDDDFFSGLAMSHFCHHVAHYREMWFTRCEKGGMVWDFGIGPVQYEVR